MPWKGFPPAQPFSNSALSQLSLFFTFFTSAPNSALDQLSPRPTQPSTNSALPFPNSALCSLNSALAQSSSFPTQPFSNSALLEMRCGGLQDGGFGGRGPPLGGRLCKKSPRTEFIVSFWFFFWEKAELGKGWVVRGLSWAKAELGKHRAELGKGRAELGEGWVGWGLSWGQFWKTGWVGRGLSWKRAELGGNPLKVRNLDRATNDSHEAHSLAPQSYTPQSSLVIYAQLGSSAHLGAIWVGVSFITTPHFQILSEIGRSDGRSDKKVKVPR